MNNSNEVKEKTMYKSKIDLIGQITGENAHLKKQKANEILITKILSVFTLVYYLLKY